MPLPRLHSRFPSQRLALGALALVIAIPAAPVLAQFRDWGPPSTWDRPGRFGSDSAPSGPDDREGKVNVARFVAAGQAGALGHGAIAINADTARLGDEINLPAFEAAAVDRLVAAGYDTQSPAGSETQIAELHISRSVVAPQEEKHKPVSGEMAVGVSNYGSMMGLAVNVDLTKPKKALLSTRVEARIRDKATGNILWEGHADIVTREGSPDWPEQKIAGRLAEALFKGFPADAGEPVAMH